MKATLYRNIFFFFILLSFIIIPTCFAKSPEIANAKSLSSYERIFYYREGPRARASLMQNFNSIDILAPQAYSFDVNGKLAGSIPEEIVTFAKDHNVKLMPLVTNGNFSQTSLQVLLDDSLRQDEAIEELVMEAKKFGFYGWQFDFEQMEISYRDKFSSFMKKFGERMKKENLISSVAVIAQISEIPADYPKNLWPRIIGVYDYKALADATDFISIMSYDDPESKGPVARYDWLKRVITHSLKYIPKEKLSLGIPLYYWEWNDDTEKLVGIGGAGSMEATLKEHKTMLGFSQSEQMPYIKYRKDKKNYTIWYEDMRSVESKLDLIKQNNLRGFSAWALGLESSATHIEFQKLKSQSNL